MSELPCVFALFAIERTPCSILHFMWLLGHGKYLYSGAKVPNCYFFIQKIHSETLVKWFKFD